MTYALHTASRASPISKATTPHSIWISDTLLAETFDRFIHGSRRHGSHVPGPMEARRRAAKRRNTSLAYAGGPGGGQVEANVLLGTGTKHAWWTDVRRTTVEKTVAPRSLPSWLGLPFAAPAPPEASVPEVDTSPLQAAQEFRDQVEHLRTRLQPLKSLNELRKHIKLLGLNLMHEPRYSEIIFTHILNARWDPDCVADFLEDHSLNTARGSNYGALMHAYAGGRYKFMPRGRLFPAMCRAISLGLVSCDHIKEILDLLPKAMIIKHGKPVSLGVDHERLHWSYYNVLTSINQSSVLSIGNLGQEFLSRFVAQIARHPRGPARVKLLWALRAYNQSWESGHLTKIVHEWVSYAAKHKGVRAGSLAEFLQGLPIAELTPVLFKITEDLITPAEEVSIDPEPLNVWETVLSAFTRSTVNGIFESRSSIPAGLSGQLNSADQLLAFCWTTVSMCVNHQDSALLLGRFDLRSRFEEAFITHEAGATQDVLAQILRALQGLPLPNKPRLLKKLNRVSACYVAVTGKAHHLISDANSLLSRELSKLLDDSFYYRATHNMNDALVEYAESINKDLPTFLYILRALIGRDKTSFRIATRILKHNRALNFALSRTARGKPGDVRQFDTSSSTSSAYGEHQVSHLDPQEVLQLMNHLAVSFAITPVVTPLSAFRKVYWCYLYLHRYGAPIQPPITRALWHAGVTRFRDTGRGTPARFKWILDKVREIEGDRVAKLLLWSAGFRSRRKGDMETFQRFHHVYEWTEDFAGAADDLLEDLDNGEDEREMPWSTTAQSPIAEKPLRAL